jgi:hypothetical protein
MGMFGSAQVTHYDGDTEGTSRYAKLVYEEVSYVFAGETQTLLVNASRWSRHGAAVAATTDLGAEYDFTLTPKLTGALSFVRASPAAHATPRSSLT